MAPRIKATKRTWLFDVMEFSFRTVSLSFMHQSPFVVASPSASVIDISKFGYGKDFLHSANDRHIIVGPFLLVLGQQD